MSIIDQVKGTFTNFFVVKEDSSPTSPAVISDKSSNKEENLKTDSR